MGRFRQEYHAIATPNPTVPRSRVPSVENAGPEIPPIPCHNLPSVRQTIVTAAIEPSFEGILHSFINLCRASKVSNTQRALYKVYITAKGRPFDQLQGRQNIDHTSKGSPVSAFFLIAGAQAGGKPSESCENVPTVMPQTLLSAGTRICTTLAFSSLEPQRGLAASFGGARMRTLRSVG